jgi:hypothetical protein
VLVLQSNREILFVAIYGFEACKPLIIEGVHIHVIIESCVHPHFVYT